MLAGDARPAEVAAVEQNLAALDDASSEPGSRRELHRMLTTHCDLFCRLSEQMADASQRYDRLLDLRHTLWLQVADLNAEAAREVLDGSEVSGRIRAAVAEIGAYADASATLRFDMPPSSE